MSESLLWLSEGLVIHDSTISYEGLCLCCQKHLCGKLTLATLGGPHPRRAKSSPADAGMRAQMHRPPSTSSTTPVRKAASSLARKSAAAPMSCGVENRPSGTVALKAARFSGVRVTRVRVGLFVLSGIISALAGIILWLHLPPKGAYVRTLEVAPVPQVCEAPKNL